MVAENRRLKLELQTIKSEKDKLDRKLKSTLHEAQTLQTEAIKSHAMHETEIQQLRAELEKQQTELRKSTQVGREVAS